MTTIAAREAKRLFGALIDTSQREPVTIEKHGRPVAVVVSKHDYDAIQAQLADYRSRLGAAHTPPSDGDPVPAENALVPWALPDRAGLLAALAPDDALAADFFDAE